MKMKFKITFKRTGPFYPPKAPEVYESYRSEREEVLDEYCYERKINRSEIQDIVPLVVSKDGPGIYGDGYYVKDSYSDKPASAFKAHTMHPKKLVGTLWRDANNRYLDYMLKITEVNGNPLDPYDLSEWEVEYVKVNPRTMQVVKGDFFGVVDPTYKRMNLAEFMHKYYCDKMQ